MDLSKAFDCLPHDILLDKLSAYGISSHSVSILKSYLSNRKQQIKVNIVLSSWADIHKGVPHWSILGTVLFNVFINDIFHFISDSSLYNYADDNTLSFCNPDFDALISTLETDSNELIEWFRINKIQANTDKFQCLAVGRKHLWQISIHSYSEFWSHMWKYCETPWDWYWLSTKCWCSY
jgi:hypothetical protein